VALLEIAVPLTDDVDHWEQLTVLDDREFRISFEWSEREEKWYLSIADQDGDILAAGLPLVEAVDILRRETDPRLPQGVLSLIDNTGAREEADRDQLGTRWVLTYKETI
jgi:hypothetical protein